MRKYLFFIFLMFSGALIASPVKGISFYPLKQIIQTNNSIVWNYKNREYHLSKPLKKVLPSLLKTPNDFVLTNLQSSSHSLICHDKNFYNIKKGWNRFVTPKNGIDVIKTFTDSHIVAVFTYDEKTQVWAVYTVDKVLQKEIFKTRLLQLKYIEPHVKFYLYATQKVKVTIQNTQLSDSCLQKYHDSSYATLLSTGINSLKSISPDKTISLRSKYMSHYKRGVYDDSRVLLIYPKVKKEDTKYRKYGPANPRIMLTYDKAYEGKDFYIFDYFQKQCFKGIFPSKKIPPFSDLLKI